MILNHERYLVATVAFVAANLKVDVAVHVIQALSTCVIYVACLCV